MPSATPPDAPDFEARFKFLFPATESTLIADSQPRYRLIAPDILEPRWCVFDYKIRRTIAYGASPVAALDTAIAVAAKGGAE